MYQLYIYDYHVVLPLWNYERNKIIAQLFINSKSFYLCLLY